MPHEFEIREEITLDATPEQVWAAITTGPGVDAWFMGRSEITPGVGGTIRQEMPGWTGESTVTVWEPGRHFAYRSEESADGLFMAFESIIEGRDGGSTVLRFVHSGFLGDDWEAEYDALRNGDRMYLEKLAAYVKHFTGRTATAHVFEVGPAVDDVERAWSAYRAVLGLSGEVSPGDRARVGVEGLEPADGVVEFVRFPYWVGVRSEQAIYTFMLGMHDTVVIEQSNFADNADEEELQQAWQSWLAKSFG